MDWNLREPTPGAVDHGRGPGISCISGTRCFPGGSPVGCGGKRQLNHATIGILGACEIEWAPGHGGSRDHPLAPGRGLTIDSR